MQLRNLSFSSTNRLHRLVAGSFKVNDIVTGPFGGRSNHRRAPYLRQERSQRVAASYSMALALQETEPLAIVDRCAGSPVAQEHLDRHISDLVTAQLWFCAAHLGGVRLEDRPKLAYPLF